MLNYRHLCPGPRVSTVNSWHFSAAPRPSIETLKRYVFRHSMRPPRRQLESGGLFGQKWYSPSGLAHLCSQNLGFCRVDRVSNPQAEKSNFLRLFYSILFLGSLRTTVIRPPKCEFDEFGGPLLRRSALRLQWRPLFDQNRKTIVKHD